MTDHTELAIRYPGGGELQLSAAREELRRAFELALQVEGVADLTVRAYLTGFDQFADWIEEEGLTWPMVSPLDIARWREHLGEEYAPQTVNLRLTAVRRFYGFLAEAGAAIANPAQGVRGVTRRGAQRHQRDELTPGEVRATLEACDDSTSAGLRDKAIISLMAYCALRAIEIQRADVGDLETKDGRPVLWVQGKGASEPDDFVVLPEPAERALLAWTAEGHKGSEDDDPLFYSLTADKGSRLTTRSIRRQVKRRMAAGGITNGRKSTHSLRHSAITSALRHGATPLQVQAMARHKSFDTTMAYVHELGRLEAPAEDLVSYESSHD